MAGKPGRSGPPKGNLNGAKSGTQLYRLVVGNLPAKLVRVQRYVRLYRRNLEDATMEVHNEVGMMHAHHIDAAVQHEQHCQVCRWLLRERIDKMSTADIRECSKQMASSKDARNRAVALLNLDYDRAAEAIDALYTVPATGGNDESK